MQLVTSIGAHGSGEHVGVFAVAGDLVIGKISSVRAVTVAVNAGGRG